VDAIAGMTSGKTFVHFDRDIVLRSAVERQFEIIGGALSQLSRVDVMMAVRVPNLRDIIASRNILIHGCAVIDRTRVWQVVESDLPQLRTALREPLTSHD
jgi:uncharacterized protein with HEPN domain